jgi:hypothetical protein
MTRKAAGIAIGTALVLAGAIMTCEACGDGDPAKPDAGDAGGSDAQVGDAPVGTDAAKDGDAPEPIVPPICSETANWTGAATPIPNVSTADSDLLGTVTSDGLSIAWVVASGGSAGTVRYADRTSTAQPFGATKTLAGTFAVDRVALSADGLTMIVVMPGNGAFGQLKRGARGDAFAGTPDTAPFLTLVGMNPEIDSGSGVRIGDPVLADDGQTLFFSQYNTTIDDTVAVSQFNGMSWAPPLILVDPMFRSQAGKRRRPTGLSADGKTLFFWDEVAGVEQATWRKTAQGGDFAFGTPLSLGARPGAQASGGDCGRLYFSAAGDGGASLDLFYAERK